jgi:hypothetical protein
MSAVLDLDPDLTITKSTDQPTPEERRAQFNARAPFAFGIDNPIANMFTQQFNETFGAKK